MIQVTCVVPCNTKYMSADGAGTCRVLLKSAGDGNVAIEIFNGEDQTLVVSADDLAQAIRAVQISDRDFF